MNDKAGSDPTPGRSIAGSPGTAGAWLQAIRPKTLPVSIVPVLVGSALAWSELGRFSIDVLVVAGLVSLLIQTGSNLYNDVADFERGGDDPAQRLGPKRAVAQGWLSARQVKTAALVSLAVAFFSGLYLVTIGGWLIFAAGVISIIAALAYSGGPRPIAYTPFGEVFVWLFFGLVAVGGTFYLQAGRQLSDFALLGGAIVGLPAAAVLAVNNTRDLESDRQSGRRTFAVLFGVSASRVQYALLLLIAFPLAIWLGGDSLWSFLPLLALPMSGQLIRRFGVADSGSKYNQLLAATARFQVLFGVLLCASLLASAISRSV
jgi:1,4-dihydroxy-2-naphthoate octaprenyltransferase